MTQTIIDVDARRRVSLGALATADRYTIEREDDGTIVLRPAVVLTEDEFKLLNRPDILHAVQGSRQDEKAGRLPADPPQRQGA